MINDIKNFAQSKTLGKIVGIIVIIAVGFGIFQAGVFVGFYKASFLFNFGDNYYKTFGEPNMHSNRGMMNITNDFKPNFFRDELSGGHGVNGKIIKIDLPNIVILGQDNIEKIIEISTTTKIHQKREILSKEKLTLDQNVIIIGTPDSNGKVIANFIRIMPSPIQQ